MFINYFSKSNTASTSYVHQKLTWIDLKWSQRDQDDLRPPTFTSYGEYRNLTWHMFFYYFSKTNWFKTVQAWYRVIKMLLDTLSDLVKLNHGAYSKYKVLFIKIWHDTCLFTIFQRQIDLKLGFPFVRESANKKVRTRMRISTNCLFTDVEKSAKNKQYSHFFKKVKVRTKCTFSKHIERIPLLWLDVCQKVIYLIGCFTVGTVQIHCRTRYLPDFRRISMTSRMGFVNFAKHITENNYFFWNHHTFVSYLIYLEMCEWRRLRRAGQKTSLNNFSSCCRCRFSSLSC